MTPPTRILVTGAGHRVGRAIAVAFGERGARVGVHYFSSSGPAEETCDLIRRAGGQAEPLQADLSERDAARSLVDEAVSRLGGLDALVPSAASFERIRFADVDDAAWDRTMRLNLEAPLAMVQQAAPSLRRSHGSVVFVTCASATVPFRNYLPYVASKGALRHLMRTLSLELAPEIRVNAVAPGTVLPPPAMDAEVVARLARRIPLGRIGEPADVARAVVFLHESPFITGHEMTVDGGRTVAGFEGG